MKGRRLRRLSALAPASQYGLLLRNCFDAPGANWHTSARFSSPASAWRRRRSSNGGTASKWSAAVALGTRNAIIGAMPERRHVAQSIDVPPGASVYLFSDGVFEIVTRSGVEWRLDDFVPLLLGAPVGHLAEPQRLYTQVRETTRGDEFDDDFSLVVLTFK